MENRLRVLLLILGLVTASDDIFLGEKHKPFFTTLPSGLQLFSWLFYSRGDPSTDPLMIYFPGGPGCSGAGVAVTENGPFRINDDLTLRL